MQELKIIIKPYIPSYDNLSDGIMVCDLTGIIIHCNTALEKFLQKPKKNIIGQHCSEEFGQRDAFQSVLMELGSRKKLLKTFTGKINNVQRKFDVCISTVFTPDSVPCGVLLIILEKIPTAIPLEQLERHGNILHAINYHTDELVVISDTKSKKNIFCSNAIIGILGWKPKDFIIGGWGFVLSLTHPDDVLQITDVYKSGIQLRNKNTDYDHLPIIFVYRKRNKDGSWRWVRSQLFILERDSKKEITKTISFLRDITIEKIHGVSLEVEINNRKAIDGLKTLWSGGGKEYNHLLLTGREKQILELVIEGHSTKDIANTLGLSVASVNSFRQKLMQKLEAKNTAELVRRAYELKIFEE